MVGERTVSSTLVMILGVSTAIDRHLDELFAPYPAHLTVRQLAEVLGIERSTAYNWLNQGRIPAYRIGNHWVILRDEVKAFVAEGHNLPPDQSTP